MTKGAKSTSGNVSPSSSSGGGAGTSTAAGQSSLTSKSVLLCELLQAPDVEMIEAVELNSSDQDEQEEEEEKMRLPRNGATGGSAKYKKTKLTNRNNNSSSGSSRTEIKDELYDEEIEVARPIDVLENRGGGGSDGSILINQSNGSQLTALAAAAAANLKPYESHCLEVIKKVTMIFHEAAPPIGKGIQIIGYATDLVQVFNNQEAHIQNMLSFTNSIGGFQSLAQQDQLVMFKAAFPEILLLRSAFFFNFEKNAFLTRLVSVCVCVWVNLVA